MTWQSPHQADKGFEDMPLVSALANLTRQDIQNWHMPGHRQGRAFPDWLKQALASFDVTELDQTGDINTVSGPVAEAVKLAAKAYGAGLTRFVTGGSTSALYLLLATAVGHGGCVLMPRSMHKAAVHAAALLDLEIGLIECGELPASLAPFSLLPQVSAEHVREAILRHPHADAVLLTSPDYYGVCPDLAAIAPICHQAGARLLVDEAHGAHLAFSPDLLPISALAAGADGCVQSAHKTLPALTPGAYLQISHDALAHDRLSEDRLDRLLPVFQTSSPSFLVAATLDYARSWAERHADAAIRRQLEHLTEFADALKPPLACSPASSMLTQAAPYRRDPLRVVVSAEPNSGLSLAQLNHELAVNGIQIEFSDLSRLVLIVGLDQPKSAWIDLANVLNRLVSSQSTSPKKKWANNLETAWRQHLSSPLDTSISLRQVLFGHQKTERVHLANAAGRISADLIAPYPPGIALVWPGDILDQSRVDFLLRLLDNNININGISDHTLWVVA